MLVGGDRRSIGRSDEVSLLVLQKPNQFGRLIECLWDRDPLVAMRAADAAEKASREKPKLLPRHKLELLGLLSETSQKELRWHLAVMIPRLQLTVAERRRGVEDLLRYLQDSSSIVKTFALQGLFDLTTQGPELYAMVVDLLRTHSRTGTPAMRARSRKLLAQMEQHERRPKAKL
jgi:hypothetical protein